MAQRPLTVILLLASVLAGSCARLPNPKADRHSHANTPCETSTLHVRHVPRLHERLHDLPPACVVTVAASAQTWPAYDARVGDVRFIVGVDANARVRFVATRDPNFVSPEGLRVGDHAVRAEAAAPAAAVVREVGWGHYIPLPSGWNALIDDSRMDGGTVDLNLGTKPLTPDARVTMFFMRD